MCGFFLVKTNREALSLYIDVSSFNVSKHFTGKGYGIVVLEDCSVEAIFTVLGLKDKGLGAIIVNQYGPEKHVANPGI